MRWENDEFWGAVSYLMGCTSVLIWLCAQMPQILKNWRRKSVEGLSFGFLVTWMLGDASNLLGCLLTGQLGVQTVLAGYYCMVDVLLAVQYVIYTRDSQYLDGVDPFTSSNGIAADGDYRNPSDNTNHLNKQCARGKFAQVYNKLIATAGVSKLLGLAQAAPTWLSLESSVRMPEHVLYPRDIGCNWGKIIGYLVAYFSTFMYLTSRLPQILHNFQRKSTTGVSMMLFISAFLGNLSYTLSILLSPQMMGKDSDWQSFLLNELSYIIGAAGTMFFDCTIVGQWFWYHRVVPRRRRSTQPLDRISRPYLGQPRQVLPSEFRAVPKVWNSLGSSETLASSLPRKSSFRKSSRSSRNSTWFEATPLMETQYSSYSENENAIEDN